MTSRTVRVTKSNLRRMMTSTVIAAGLFAVTIGGFGLVSNLSPAKAATGNNEISFQGKLVNSDGTNVTDGAHSVVFSLYSVASGGSNVWTETDSVTTTDGVFQVDLGAGTALPGSANFTSGDLYLGIKVSTDAEMTPRIHLTAAAYAMYANNSAQLGGVAAASYARLDQNNTFTGTQKITNSSNGALLIQNAGGTTQLLDFDASTSRLAVGLSSAPAYTIDAGGDINTTGVYRVSGTAGVAASACGGGQVYEGNAFSGGILTTAGTCTAVQAAGNYLVQGPTSTAANTVTPGNSTTVALTLRQASSGTQDLLDFTNNAGSTTLGHVDNSGNFFTAGVIDTQAASTTLNLGASSSPNTNLIQFNANATVAAGKNLTLAAGAGSIVQTFQSGSAAGNAHAIAVANTNAGLAATTQGINVTPTNTTAPSSGVNTLNGINFASGTVSGGNITHAVNFASGTGYTDFINYNNTTLLSNAGILQNAAFSGSYGNITGIGNSGAALALVGSSTSNFQVTSGTNTSTLKFGTPTGAGGQITLPDTAGASKVVCYQSDSGCGFLLGAAGSYIQNALITAAAQGTASFHIDTSGRADVSFVAPLFTTMNVSSGNSADVTLQSGNVTAGTGSSGNVIVDAGTFQVGGSGGILSVGTTSAGSVNLGNRKAALAVNALASGSSLKFSNAANDGSIKLTFATPASGKVTTYNFADPVTSGTATYTICTTDNDSCKGSGIGTGYIQNQTASTQTAGFNISGAGSLGGNLTVTGTYNTNTFDATHLIFGSATGGNSVQAAAGAALALTAHGTSTWSTDAGNLTIQNSANGGVLSIASNGASGTDSVSIDAGGGSGNTGTVNIGNTNTLGINIGTNNAAHTIAIGNYTGATGTNSVTIGGNGNAANTVSIESGTGTGAIAIGNAASAHNIKIGTDNGSIQTILAGSTNVSSTVTLQGGATTEFITSFGDTIQTSTNSTTAFQLLNKNSNALIAGDTTNTNLITNSSFESNASGWAALGSASTPTRDTANSLFGRASGKVITTAATNDGAKFINNPVLSNGTVYYFSFWAISGSGTVPIGFGNTNGGSVASCNTGTITTTWARYTCNFTASSQAGTDYVFVRQTDANIHTFYIDGVQLETTGLTAYHEGQVQLNGLVTAPVTVKNTGDSTAALDVQNSSGVSQLAVDTANSQVMVGGTLLVNTITPTGAMTIGSTGQNLTIQGTGGTAGNTKIVAGSGGNVTTLQFASPSGTTVLTLPTGTGTICTTVSTTCSATYQTSGNFLAKNAVDSSSFGLAASATLLTLTNSGSNNANVIKLDSGTGVGDALFATAAASATAGSAVIFGSSTLNNATGNLFDLWSTQSSTAASRFSVATTGATSIGGQLTVTSATQNSITGGLSLSGGLNNNSGGITNAGAISGATTIAASTSITVASTVTLTAATGGNELAVSGTPLAVSGGGSSLVQLGNAISGGNASGTYLGINEPSSGAGSASDFIDFQNNNSIKLKVDNNGNTTIGGALTVQTTGSAFTGSISATTLISATGGYLVSGTPSVGTYLRSNGTSFIGSAMQPADIPVCSGACNYISNQTTQQSGSNFNISGSGIIGTALTVGGNATATADLSFANGAGRKINVITAASGSGSNLTIVGGQGASGNNNGGSVILQGGASTGSGTSGSVIVLPNVDNTSAFLVQNAAQTVNVETVDTTNLRVNVSQILSITDSGTPSITSVTPTSATSGTLNGVTTYYKMTAVNSNGEGLASAEYTFPQSSFITVNAPSGSMTLGQGGLGGYSGTYNYALTYVTANGETTPGATNSIGALIGSQINVSNIPLISAASIPGNVTARNLYRCTGANCTDFRLLATFAAGNNATTFTDSGNSGALGTALIPSTTVNTATSTTNTVSIAFTGVAGAASYKLYRGTTSNSENVLVASGITSSPTTDAGGGSGSSGPTSSGLASVGIGTTSPTANLEDRGTALFRNNTNTTTAFRVQNASASDLFAVDTTNGYVLADGNLGVNTNTPSRGLDVVGDWGGNVVTDFQTGTATPTISTKALAYYFALDTGTTNNAFTDTVNITGLPDTDGTFAFITTEVSKGTTAGTRLDTITVQINGTQVSSLGTNAGVGATTVSAESENYTVVRTNGTWKVVGYGPTASGGNAGGTFGADLAEYIHYTGIQPQAGEVLTVGDSAISAKDASSPYDSKLLGVVTTNPAQIYGRDDGHSMPMALTGRVPVKVSLENGVIEPGDYLTSSSTPGVAMKATRPGQAIGTALGGYDGTGDATVTVQLHVGYADPTNGTSATNLQGNTSINGNLAISGDLIVAGTTNTKDLVVTSEAQINNAQIASLTVTGSATVNGDLTVSGTTTLANVVVSGSVRLAGDLNLAGVGASRNAITKQFKASVPIAVGAVVVADAGNDGQVTTTATQADTKVLGVAMTAANNSGDTITVAIGGTVQVLASTSAPTLAGDLLVSSASPGLAETAPVATAGAILGKALTKVDPATGLLWVLITLQ